MRGRDRNNLAPGGILGGWRQDQTVTVLRTFVHTTVQRLSTEDIIMAKSAAKSLAVRNKARLQQTHLITLGIHIVFLVFAFFIRRSLSLYRYVLLSVPGLLIEAYLHVLATPTYGADGNIRSAGSDLSEKGLTEFMWDIVYWTWINLIAVVILGNWAWWLYLVVPAYAIYAAVSTASGVKGMLSGMGGARGDGAEAQSKRQAKMEKRGGQKATYR